MRGVLASAIGSGRRARRDNARSWAGLARDGINAETDHHRYLGFAGVSYYIKDMSADETINGTPVTEAQIAEWAAEAEAGYDVEALKKRGRGRPGRGAEPSQVVALRLTAEELAALDAAADREHKSRSELIREALAIYAA